MHAGVGDGGTGAVCGVCSGLAVKTPERRHWRRPGVFIVDFGRGWRIVLVFLLWTLGRLMPAVGITNFNDKFSLN